MPEEVIHLHTSGSLPGIPGHHGAGAYWVDWDARTIRPYAPQDAQPEKTQSPDVKTDRRPSKPAKNIEE
jgi:hypothetical protein